MNTNKIKANKSNILIQVRFFITNTKNINLNLIGLLILYGEILIYKCRTILNEVVKRKLLDTKNKNLVTLLKNSSYCS